MVVKIKVLKEKINSFAKENNLIWGFVSVENIEKNKSKLIDYFNEETDKETPFVNYSLEERISPKATMHDAQTIIAVGMPYKKNIPEINSKNDEYLRGYISISALGVDYHKKLKNYLEKIVFILQNAQDGKSKSLSFEVFVDTGPLNERILAVLSGLGKVGRNQCVISEKFGSFFFIGYILTNEMYNFSGNNEENYKENYNENIFHENCKKCGKCIKVCPGNALENGFDYQKCRSYLTQKKCEIFEFSEEEKRIIGNSVYGCDLCQKVCPCNKEVSGENAELEKIYPLLDKFENMSNKKFKEEFGETGIFWRGKKVIKRNAEIVKENNLKKCKGGTENGMEY